jgi:hypothetical protein
MKLYKLTTQDGRTRPGLENETQWGEGVEHTAPGGDELCTAAYLHAYTDPLLAVMMNPAHADLSTPAIWECDGDVELSAPDKVGCTRLRTLRQIELPQITTVQRVRFAILAAQAVIRNMCPKWSEWAQRWLSGEDRSTKAARAAWAAAVEAAGASLSKSWSTSSRRLAAVAAREAAWGAVEAAEAWATGASRRAAAWAAVAAAAAAAEAADLDLVALARRAMEG